MAMHGSINAPSYLPSLYAARAQGASLLAALYGNNDPDPAEAHPIAALDRALAERAEQVAVAAARPDVERDLARFHLVLEAARAPRDLAYNANVLKILLTAHGMADQVQNRTLAARALLSDPTKPGALVTRLGDPRWITLARALGFATDGLTALRAPGVAAEICRAYAEALWRQTLDRSTPGLARAVDFVARAATIANVEQVLNDPTFHAVLVGVATFPGAPQREEAIARLIDLTRLRDPAFVRQTAEAYLIRMAPAR